MNLKKSGLMGFLTSLAVIGSSIVGLGVGAATAASSPITVTFESDDTSGASLGGSADFGGNTSSVVDSTVGTNTSKVGKIVNGADCWSGTTFLIKSSGWQLISDVSKTISADVYSTVAISNVKMKVEGGASDPSRELDVAHGGTGWERLTWDLSTGAAFAPGNYIKASIFVGFACGTSSVHPAETFIDNVSFPGATAPDVVVPRTTPQVLVNFESTDTSGYAFIGFGGSSGSVDASAPAGGSVGSTKAFKITEGIDCWGGTTFLKRGAKESLISAANPIVKANIYSPASGKAIRLKLENSANGAFKELDVVSVAGWKTYSWDFTGLDANVDYNMANLFVNFTCGAGSKTSDAWYVDDVVFNGAVGANLEAAVTPVLVNFESNDSSGYSLISFGGNVSATDSSAPTGGSVGSTSALKITNGADCWSGTTFLSSTASLLATGKTTVKANVYSPAAGKVIRLKLEDSSNGDIFRELDATSVQGWNTYTWDFTTFNSAQKYNKASIFVDFTCGGGAKAAGDWYVDDIAFLGAVGAALAGSGGGGGNEPTPFTGNAVIRLVGADSTNTFNRQADADFFVSQGWYRGGLRVMTKQVPVASTQNLTWVVSDAANGSPLANVKVKFIFGKQYSGSTAKVNVGNDASTGNEKVVEGVTAADGTVTFSLANTDVAADAADYPTGGLGTNYSGKHLFSQVTAWVSNQNQDSIDIVDLVYFKPQDAPVVKTIVTRVTGIDETNAYVGSCEGWCQYYAAGLRYFERGVQVGSTTTLNWTITDTDGAPYANKSVKLLLGKTYSGSNAKVSVNGTAFPGSGDEKVINLTTDANGLLSFDVVNSNFNADADPYQASNLKHPDGGKHLFVQIAVVGEKGNQDVLDIIDLNYYQPQDAGPAVTYNVRLADWNASNSFDGTRVWGDGGIGSWFPANTGYFAKYVAAGSTFNLRYKVTNAETGALAPNGTVVTLQLGSAWSGSNAKFTVNGVNVDGITKWGGSGQLDQASTTAVVSNGFITVPVTALDPAIDATTNPGSPRANPDTLNPLFMQVKVKVEGNAITQQDWVNIIATKPLEAAPVITAISSTTGKKGQAIDIVGTNLGDALGSTVTLHTPATTRTAAINTPVTVLSVNETGTRLTVVSPTISQKGYFKVTNTGGTGTASKTFTASTSNTLKPSITLTSSLVKEVGSTFTLNGSNLASASNIAIGGVSAPFTILTASSVVVTVPEGVTSGSTISATNLGGTVTTSKFVYQAAVVNSFTTAARVGQSVTFTGKNLKATSVIFAGNKTGKIVSSSATSLTVTVPTGALSGAIKITTGAGAVFTESFTVTPPAPTVTSFTPTTAKKGVTLVTVRGTNLTGATVTLGSVQVTLAAGANSTSFKFIVPSSAVTGKITVTTGGGTVTSTNNLVVTN